MIKKLNNLSEQTKNYIAIGLAIFALVLFVGISIYSSYKDSREEYKEKLVTDNNRYYTVLNCVKKYIGIVASRDKENILITLDEDYKTSNAINENNVYTFVPNISNTLPNNYTSEEMYEQRIAPNILKYKVHGYLTISRYDEDPIKYRYNLIVYLYEETLTFSVKPEV